MMCRTRLICRFPARESRWRTWSPEEASIGAVPFPGGEVRAVGEPGDVADLDQQPGRTGGSDAVHVHECGAGGGDQLFQLGVGGLLALVDPFQVADQLRGHAAAGLAGGVAGPDLGE